MNAINAILHCHFRNQNRLLKGTGTKRDVCPGSLVRTTAKSPVVPMQSAPMRGVTLRVQYAARPSVLFTLARP